MIKTGDFADRCGHLRFLLSLPGFVDIIIFMSIESIVKKIFKKEKWEMPGMQNRFFCTEDCDGCGLCEESCPTGHIKMVDGRPVWPKPCLLCAACADVCPNHAIAYGTNKQIEEYKKAVRQKNAAVDPSHYGVVTEGDTGKSAGKRENGESEA